MRTKRGAAQSATLGSNGQAQVQSIGSTTDGLLQPDPLAPMVTWPVPPPAPPSPFPIYRLWSVDDIERLLILLRDKDVREFNGDGLHVVFNTKPRPASFGRQEAE